jgi:RNA polymerase sigma factor (TIGR02999 family)
VDNPKADSKEQVTRLLLAWSNGDPAALDTLVPIVHGQLRGLARRCMAGERAGHTLQTNALVNEAYLRMVDMRRVEWRDRAHFFAIAARIMRRILVDMARAKRFKKRGGEMSRVTLDEALLPSSSPAYDVLGVDAALEALAAMDPRRGKVVELRIFGGLSVEETAAALGVSTDTVSRDWKLAKAWLARHLADAEPGRVDA